MMKNAIYGMLISMLFAWIVLLITTKNYIVSFQAVLSISLVIATIMSSIMLQGWTLGIAESIGLIVFVGFSVDYIVHMCHQYVESIFEKRKKKMDSCFNQIGSTILNGAVTSFFAGLFLYFCQFSYLHKFGILMMITIVSSLGFSMIFYPALSYIRGPQNKEGDIMYNILNPLKRRVNAFRGIDQDNRPPTNFGHRTSLFFKGVSGVVQKNFRRTSANESLN